MSETPETILMIVQREAYSFIDKQKELEKDCETAAKILKEHVERVEYNKQQIRDCADFLQEHCPDAIKGTWLQEFGLEQ